MKSVMLVILAFGLAQGAVVPFEQALNNALEAVPLSQAGIQADMSEWVDQIFANVRAEMKEQGLDAIPFPDQRISFEKKILGVTWHGEAAIYDGVLRGLDTIKRTGVADLTYEGGDMIITVDAGVNNAGITASMLAKFMNLGPTATITGTLTRVQVKLTIRANIQSFKAQVDKLDIKNLGVLSIDVKGLGFILNFLVEIVANVLGNLIKGIVGEVLQGPIKNIINNILANISLPPAAVAYASAPQAVPHIFPRARPNFYIH